ncbi:MAG: hypothetical protein J0L51_07180 [Rhizobiales bacterium]|nr:hypothetical protein [Hyphomicrobiales bacterium]
MHFDAEERTLAIATAFRALVASLVDTGVLDTATFEEHSTRGVAWLERIGETRASSALAEFIEPLLADMRRADQPRGNV